jgi:CheY-like chemotaxis protein
MTASAARILVVDDDASIPTVSKSALMDTVDLAEDGLAALDHIAELPPDVG